MGRLLEFYTDGAFSSKSEMGGWASICVEENKIILGGHENGQVYFKADTNRI